MKSKLTIDEDGTKRWKLPNGQLHRKNGPAIERSNGYKAWYLNSLCHRKDGPAVEYIEGSKSWHLNGLKHREDGPAMEYSDGDKVWYLNGIRNTEQEYKHKIRYIKLKQLL
jgi:hypothetical protein